MGKIYKNFRILLKYLRKFLGAIVTVIPFVKINLRNYPFAKEYKAINQDFLAVGDDIKLVISKHISSNEQNKRQ